MQIFTSRFVSPFYTVFAFLYQNAWVKESAQPEILGMMCLRLAGGSRIWPVARGDLSDFGVNKTCHSMLLTTVEEALHYSLPAAGEDEGLAVGGGLVDEWCGKRGRR